MFSKDKDTLAEILLIVGGYILAETIIRQFVDLAASTLDPWVLPAFSIAIIISALSLRRGDKGSVLSITTQITLGLFIGLIVLYRSSLVGPTFFIWGILILSVISILIGIVQLLRVSKS